MNPKAEIEETLQRMGEALLKAVKDEWKAQGKVASGKALETAEVRVVSDEIGSKAQVLVEDYMAIQDKGVPASRIPYSGRTGRGGTSQFIQALVDWSRSKMPSMADGDRLGFAFAVANKMAKEGMPTRNSVEFSSNGRNLEWSKYAFQEVESELDEILGESDFVVALIDNLIEEVNAEIA
jgi:alpha/beta superfamily hydrolase